MILPAWAAVILLGSATSEVRITQKHLVPVCVDGQPVTGPARRFALTPGEHTLLATMRNAPRTGVGTGADAGYALVRFTVKPGARYEVEVRADDPASYSRREWIRGEWRPAVRERQPQDGVVSGDPEWTADGTCR
jgi:hypothetical protein